MDHAGRAVVCADSFKICVNSMMQAEAIHEGMLAIGFIDCIICHSLAWK